MEQAFGIPVTLWCSLYCEGNEAVGEMEIDYDGGKVVSLPLCQECADTLQKNPALALDLEPGDVLDLNIEDALGNPEQQASNQIGSSVQDEQ